MADQESVCRDPYPEIEHQKQQAGDKNLGSGVAGQTEKNDGVGNAFVSGRTCRIPIRAKPSKTPIPFPDAGAGMVPFSAGIGEVKHLWVIVLIIPIGRQALCIVETFRPLTLIFRYGIERWR